MLARTLIGVDLGQRQDYTAIAVLDRIEDHGSLDLATWSRPVAVSFDLRFLQRLPLGSSYVDVAARIREVAARALDRFPFPFNTPAHARCAVVADATGVGAPVMDVLRDAGLPCPLLPVLITPGGQTVSSHGAWHVPKRDLVAGLQVLLERGLLRIPANLPFGPELVDELRNFRVRFTPAGHETYAAWRETAHDDLVLAVALAAFPARFPSGGEMPWRLPGI